MIDNNNEQSMTIKDKKVMITEANDEIFAEGWKWDKVWKDTLNDNVRQSLRDESVSLSIICPE